MVTCEAIKPSEKQQHKMKAISSLLPQVSPDTAAKNGMTIEQVAASMIVRNNKAACSNPECLAIFRDKAKSIDAFDRVAQIDETDKGSPFIPTDILIAAILG